MNKNLRIRDWLLTFLLGAVFFFVYQFLAVPGIDPSLWEDVAVVSRLRPPHLMFPGLWRVLTFGLFATESTTDAAWILSLVGSLAGAVCAGLTYRIVRRLLAVIINVRDGRDIWRVWIAPFFSVVATILYCASDPMMETFRIFSPTALFILLTLSALSLLFRWFVEGGTTSLLVVFSILGLIAAESPIGFLFIAGFVFAYWRLERDDLVPVSRDELPQWKMFFLFLAFAALSLWSSLRLYVFFGGAAANGYGVSEVLFHYALSYLTDFLSWSSAAGWALGLGFGIVPLVVALSVFPLLVRDDRPMTFQTGGTMLFVGVVALMQTGVVPSTRFWLLFEGGLVNSSYLLTFYGFCSALAVALFGASFTFESQLVYRNEDEPPPNLLLRFIVLILALGVVCALLARTYRPIETEMQKIVDQAIDETVEEAGDARFVFTDGVLDAGIEIAAHARGSHLKPINMLSWASGWERAVRSRHFPTGADRSAAEMGVPTLLRVWAGEKPGGMDESALQLGFDFWKRERKKMPVISGLLAREKGMDEVVAQRGVDRASILAQRILSVAEQAPSATPSPALTLALSDVSWRLSCLARLRGDSILADRLDAANSSLKSVEIKSEQERQRTFMQLTPREGLQIALHRADMTETHKYALAVLRSDPTDPEGNFGMGLYCMSRKRKAEAELYLLKCLERRPEEPVVLNNLSILCRQDRRWKEAVDYAKRALKMMPGNEDIIKTLKRAQAHQE